MDCSPPGSSVHGILQTRKTRILEWVAISFFGDLPDSVIKPVSHKFFTFKPPERPQINYTPIEKKKELERKKKKASSKTEPWVFLKFRDNEDKKEQPEK